MGKFDSKSDVGIFLRYSNTSKVYRVFNKRTSVVEESMHVTFDELNSPSSEKDIDDDVGIKDIQIGESSKGNQYDNSQEKDEH